MKTLITLGYVLVAVLTLIATSESHATAAGTYKISNSTIRLFKTGDPNAQFGEPTCEAGRRAKAEYLATQTNQKRAVAEGVEARGATQLETTK